VVRGLMAGMSTRSATGAALLAARHQVGVAELPAELPAEAQVAVEPAGAEVVVELAGAQVAIGPAAKAVLLLVEVPGKAGDFGIGKVSRVGDTAGVERAAAGIRRGQEIGICRLRAVEALAIVVTTCGASDPAVRLPGRRLVHCPTTATTACAPEGERPLLPDRVKEALVCAPHCVCVCASLQRRRASPSTSRSNSGCRFAPRRRCDGDRHSSSKSRSHSRGIGNSRGFSSDSDSCAGRTVV
jgi:hypothetical protein